VGRVGILYFSGTGNTWRIAREYGRGFGDRGHEVDLLTVEEVMRSDGYTDLAEYDLLGLGFPVHGFNPPKLVARFMARLPRSEGQHVFLFVTAIGVTGRALDGARKALTRAGYEVVHEARYYTGADYYFSRSIRLKTQEEIERQFAWCAMDAHEAAEILDGSESRVRAGGAMRVFSYLLGRLYLLGCKHGSRYWHADDRCDACGLCARACPAGNIRLVEGRPAFGSECIMCLRCLSICPQQAIQYGSLFKKMGRYLAPGYADLIAHDETK